MRGFAVALVVADHTLLALHIYHIGPWLSEWIGDFGVYLFFVHTALVLMWSLERRPHTLDFYIRRVFRIYPLAWLAILVAIVFKSPLSGTVHNFFVYHPLGLFGIAANALLVHDLVHFVRPAIGVMWTLPFEIQMYLLLPPLFFFIQKNKVIWPLLLFWALAVAYSRYEFNEEINFAVTIPFFLPGVMAYVGFKRVTPAWPAWSFFPLLLILLSVFMISPSHHHGWYAVFPLGLLLPYFRQTRVVWLQRAGHNLAKYSYGIYLSHSFALVLGIYLLPHAGLWLQLAVVFSSLVAMSVAAYHLLEKPLIDLGARVAARVEIQADKRKVVSVI